MVRLVTDEQVKRIAGEYATAIVGELYLARPVPMARDDFSMRVRQAIEHDLTDTLEGLMEPDEGR